jgi:hypothetical protein
MLYQFENKRYFSQIMLDTANTVGSFSRHTLRAATP